MQLGTVSETIVENTAFYCIAVPLRGIFLCIWCFKKDNIDHETEKLLLY